MNYSNILLIDDDSDDREMFLEAIYELEKNIICNALASAIEALHHLADKAALLPDIIFLDLNMPVMNGEEFLAKIKSDEGLKNIPVIILSTASNSTTIEKTKELGAMDFITKPNSFKGLVKALESVLF